MDAIIVTSVTRRIIAAMGHWGTGPHSNPNCLLFFWSLQSRTNSDIGHVVAYPERIYWPTALSLFIA